MTALVIRQSEVRRLLPMERCIDLMADALASLGRGEGQNPLRWAMHLSTGGGILGMMPGETEQPAAMGLKIVGVFPANEGTAYDSHQGLVLLFDPQRGFPIAMIDACEITAIRTAAVSGLATRLLAREDAGDLAILGSGVQARTHLQAMMAVRQIRRVRVYSPRQESREAFAEAASRSSGLTVEPVTSAFDAVNGADLICTVTSSSTPVVKGEWLAPGTHINAVGSSVASARELDGVAMARCRLFVDRRESTLNEAGDFLMALEEGAIDDQHIVAEIGELLLGQAEGRGNPEEITLFKSLGLAVEDLVSAHYILKRAREEGLGVEVEVSELPDGGA